MKGSNENSLLELRITGPIYASWKLLLIMISLER